MYQVSVDSVTERLPRRDEFGRPFGSVFNLHPDYSRIFVGGFPSSAAIQDAVRETYMLGQMEGLKLGRNPIGKRRRHKMSP